MRFSRLFFVIGTLAAACTRPAADVGPDLVATQAASTLTADSSPPPTGGLPTWTPPPSATVPATATWTLTPSPTVGPSPTSTAPALPTEDPRFGLNLSVPDYSDDFSERFLWFEFSDPASATNLWQDGAFRTTDHLTDSFIWWSTSAQSGGNTYAEITSEIGACQAKDDSGVALRVGGENFDRGYSLEFACDGTYRIRKWVSGEAPVVLLDWTASPHILAGPEASNRMGFLASGTTLYAFANGEPLSGVEDPDYASGLFALYAAAAETTDLTVTFDNFATWTLTP